MSRNQLMHRASIFVPMALIAAVAIISVACSQKDKNGKATANEVKINPEKAKDFQQAASDLKNLKLTKPGSVLSIAITADKEIVTNEPFELTTTMTLHRSAENINYKWILPPHVQLVQGSTTGNVTAPSAGGGATLKHKFEATSNDKIHLILQAFATWNQGQQQSGAVGRFIYDFESGLQKLSADDPSQQQFPKPKQGERVRIFQ